MVYAGATLYRWGDRVRSHAGLGIAGVLLIAVSIAAGMGLAALTGLTLNASSTQERIPTLEFNCPITVPRSVS